MTSGAGRRPMLARLAREVPVGAYSYEPKWDGFRCLASARGPAVRLQSRNGRPLERYFPEVAQALAALGIDAVLDGELVVAGPDFDFPRLLARLHPSPTRVERLRRETPASFIAFDLLATGGEDLALLPFLSRRARRRSPGSRGSEICSSPSSRGRSACRHEAGERLDAPRRALDARVSISP